MRTLRKLSNIQDGFDLKGKVPMVFGIVVLDQGLTPGDASAVAGGFRLE
jgi:hypothetical protein